MFDREKHIIYEKKTKVALTSTKNGGPMVIDTADIRRHEV